MKDFSLIWLGVAVVAAVLNLVVLALNLGLAIAINRLSRPASASAQPKGAGLWCPRCGKDGAKILGARVTEAGSRLVAACLDCGTRFELEAGDQHVVKGRRRRFFAG